MASRAAITMVDSDNVLKFFGEKLNAVIEGFKENEVWLKEIQEEARKMFISDFNAEPELMPKTPSERKRRRRRPPQDHNKRFSRSRKSLRRSSIQRPKLISRVFEEDNSDCNKIVEQAHPVRLTRASARAAATASLETVKQSVSPVVLVNCRVPLVELSLNDRKRVELYQKGQMANLAQTLLTFECENLLPKAVEAKSPPLSGLVLETLTPAVTAVNPSSSKHEATKLKINAVTTKENAVDGESGLANWELSHAPAASEGSISEEDENQSVRSSTRSTRRSVRKSMAKRRSSCVRLMDKYSLNVQRTAMVQESTRKSLRKSIARRKNALESSASSYHSSIEKMEENAEKECVEAISSTILELEQAKEEKQAATLFPENQDRRCTRNATKIAMSDLEKEVADAVSKPQACRSSSRIQSKDSSESDKLNSDNQSLGRKQSYKRGVENVFNDSDRVLKHDDSPPRKKTPSPPCPASKVVRPKHKSFLHAVQKNQLLMTPVSVGRTMVQSFIKRNTPLKVDPKEKEKIRLANLKKKQEQEEERIQKVEEQKKRKLEALKKKREMQLKRVLETRSRVELQEEERRKKIEQKLSQLDGKNEKVREERFAEEKAKKKIAAKRMEEAETRRRLEEEARNQKLQQLEEERQELLQHKKEEELERQRKMAEAKKVQEQRQAELEKERQRELQLAADTERERRREQERIQAEKERERLAKERALQLQRELERTAREDAALQAQQEKKRLHKEAQEKDRKQHSPAPESYTMTPNGYSKLKLPKINLDNYGMDLNSDDSTDDEGAPRKPIPAWADGNELQQALVHQYYHPPDLDKFFGVIQPPNLETIFGKSKPRYLKRTSSAVWHSPPLSNSVKNVPFGFRKY
ncbi:inner centromere protein-like isoform X2 [Heptranchias perlo]|uniref:inner centromere protein-like isoform X2 n=1 Tax=Heptranchias perlo TaxID=212740 RepID=UPI00355AB6F0